MAHCRDVFRGAQLAWVVLLAALGCTSTTPTPVPTPCGMCTGQCVPVCVDGGAAAPICVFKDENGVLHLPDGGIVRAC